MADQTSKDEFNWRCGHCSSLNEAQVARCSECNYIRPYPTEASESYFSEEDHDSLPQAVAAASQASPQYDDLTSACVPSTSYDTPSSFAPEAKFSQESGSAYKIEVLNDSAEERLDFSVDVCRLVILGKTGKGKSSSANTIVGSQQYHVSKSLKSTTERCQWHEVQRFGVRLEVVDTPGFFDTDVDDAVVTKEIVKCIGVVCPGPHALLITVRIDEKFTEEEAKAVEMIRDLFGPDIMRHAIVVFTHGDTVDGMNINELLATSPPPLQRLLEETERRFVVFNNREKDRVKNDAQVRELLRTVRGLLASSGDEPYTNPFLSRCQEMVVASTENLSEMLEESCTSDSTRQLMRKALATRDNVEELLHEVLDGREQEAAVLEKQRKKLAQIEAEKAQAHRKLEEANEKLKLLEKNATEKLKELEKEKEKVNKEAKLAKDRIHQLEDETKTAGARIKNLEGEKNTAEKQTKRDEQEMRRLAAALKEAEKLEADLRAELQTEREKRRCIII